MRAWVATSCMALGMALGLLGCVGSGLNIPSTRVGTLELSDLRDADELYDSLEALVTRYGFVAYGDGTREISQTLFQFFCGSAYGDGVFVGGAVTREADSLVLYNMSRFGFRDQAHFDAFMQEWNEVLARHGKIIRDEEQPVVLDERQQELISRIRSGGEGPCFVSPKN